jgi:hypothetical protein
MTRRKKTSGRPLTRQARIAEAISAAKRTRLYSIASRPCRWACWIWFWISRLVEWLFSFPPVGAAIAVTGVVAGFWASLYTTEIKASIPDHPFDVPHYLRLRGTAGFFWLMLAIFGFGFIAQQWAQSRGARRAQKNLVSKSSELEDMVRNMRSLPPHSFLTEFQDLYEKAYPLGLLAFTQPKKEVLEGAIRKVLECVARLASNFDRDAGHNIFSANVMIYRDRDWLLACNDDARSQLEQQLKFADDLPTPKTLHLGGVLTLSPTLTVSFDARQNEPSSTCTPSIALPIPIEAVVSVGEKKTLSRVLPGAPWAAVNLRYTNFSSIDEMLLTFDETCDFTELTRSQVVTYFDENRGDLKSFLSIPLEVPTTGADIDGVMLSCGKPGRAVNVVNVQQPLGSLSLHPELGAEHDDGDTSVGCCLGVLNLHCSKEGMLNTDGTNLFMPLMEPFIRVLVQLIGSYRALD